MFEGCYLLIASYLSITVSSDQIHSSRRKIGTQIINVEILISHK